MRRRPTSQPIAPTGPKRKIRVMRKRPIINFNADENVLEEEDRSSSILTGANDDERNLKVFNNIITKAPRYCIFQFSECV